MNAFCSFQKAIPFKTLISCVGSTKITSCEANRIVCEVSFLSSEVKKVKKEDDDDDVERVVVVAVDDDDGDDDDGFIVEIIASALLLIAMNVEEQVEYDVVASNVLLIFAPKTAILKKVCVLRIFSIST